MLSDPQGSDTHECRRSTITAEPNGAGKTSFANKHFDKPRAGLVYLKADEIARHMPAG